MCKLVVIKDSQDVLPAMIVASVQNVAVSLVVPSGSSKSKVPLPLAGIIIMFSG